MSYCRWSSDDYRCDLYVYESHRGFEVIVASRRHGLTDVDLPPPAPDGDHAAWARRYVEVSRLLEEAELFPIGLPHDGEHFVRETPGECAKLVEELRAVGYRVPQDAIDILRAEVCEVCGDCGDDCSACGAGTWSDDYEDQP